ncbi:MAG: insulinase family protein [Oscillospiraceae bacterium]|nr:insulinase family protein [Oscillospiraceae bacterium]
MEIKRAEIMPGVWLNHLRSDKFKTACMSISLLTQLNRETASMNALIPFVLRRGTVSYGDMEAISNRLDELYGAAVEPVVRRIGEIQCLGFYASIPEEDYLPKGESVLQGTAELMGQLLLRPATRGGLLMKAYVDSEREKLLELIRSRINEKRGYALFRCIEEMCCFEDFAVSRYGSESDCEGINYKELSKQYHELLNRSPVEIFYCGRADFKKLKSVLRDALSGFPRGEIDYDIGTDVRMNAVEAEPRYVQEELNVTQGKLVMGFRLGECMEEPDLAALYVFNAVYGSGTTSKLFMNVREKLSLCYYAGSLLDTHKGLMFVSSGIEFDKFDAAKSEILAQLEEIKAGNVTNDELNSAKAGIASDLRSMSDVQGDLEGFYLANTVDGLDCTPEELAELVEEVSLEDVKAIANSIELDLVYFLCGDGEEEEDED